MFVLHSTYSRWYEGVCCTAALRADCHSQAVASVTDSCAVRALVRRLLPVRCLHFRAQEQGAKMNFGCYCGPLSFVPQFISSRECSRSGNSRAVGRGFFTYLYSLTVVVDSVEFKISIYRIQGCLFVWRARWTSFVRVYVCTRCECVCEETCRNANRYRSRYCTVFCSSSYFSWYSTVLFN